jgi:hypothetical protein
MGQRPTNQQSIPLWNGEESSSVVTHRAGPAYDANLDSRVWEITNMAGGSDWILKVVREEEAAVLLLEGPDTLYLDQFSGQYHGSRQPVHHI